MVIFRENTEDIYAGIEFREGTPEAVEGDPVPPARDGREAIRFPASSAIGIKPVSDEGTKRLIRAAIEHALAHNGKSVTLVHKGNIMKYTEGGVPRLGLRAGQRGVRRGGARGRPVAAACRAASSSRT